METTWIEKSVSRDVTVLAEVDSEGDETGNFQYWYPEKVVELTAEPYNTVPRPEPVTVEVDGVRWRVLATGALAGAVAGGVAAVVTSAVIH